jgi:hypothetical protein
VSKPPVSEDSVRDELSRILASHVFHASKRSCEFLTYVVENTLQGKGDSLKERSIGIDVFGRSTAYDPSDDATVRVKAGEVRKRLNLYYSTEGSHNLVRIELPSGTYVPEFRAAEEVAVPAPVTSAETALANVPAEPETRRRIRPWMTAAAVIAVVSMASVAGIWFTSGRSTTLDQFWAPVLSGGSPVSLCVAWVPVYGTDKDPVPDQPPKPEELTLLRDQFVGGGDLVAASRLSSMLSGKKHPFYLRVGNAVAFNDLRAAPAILIGYSYTRWKEISSELRYFIDVSRRPIGITDNGKATSWNLPDLPRDRETDRDYAIVSRVFHPDTHAMLVEIAGITQYGTEAASDLVTNPELIEEALRKAPAGWQKKNLQLVLYSRVISGAPTPARVVASYFW